LLELLCFGGAIAIALFLLASRSGVGGALPWLGLYALAGYRLFPAVQYAFASVSMVRYHAEGFLRFASEIETLERAPAPPPAPPVLPLRQRIEIKGLSYFYPDRPTPAVDNLTFTIAAGKIIGIVGKSGSGKTTLLDLLLGFLPPAAGEILIDGMRLEAGNARSWQRQVGYVPQHFFLLDDTVLANIAVGAEVPDLATAERAAQAAGIHDFIASLPQGYRTAVGERGSRLSGGQRQRLAIARALYRDPQILVFDEATSALDAATEAAIMASIQRLASGRTVIFATHRFSTLRYCENICFLENGRLLAVGTYEELLRHEPRFAALGGYAKGAADIPGQEE
ncbi:MAG: ATP-binding cassette domain-containing protein, partial [Planctomycetota bacterium]|nr:ATP-binding cassette domain-containing protein [Planctomycetota bacterium]